jgi:hypothetical protein
MPSLRLLAASACAAAFFACDTTDGGPDAPKTGAAHLHELLFNPAWYRTYDSAHSITPSEGTLLFAWSVLDTARHPDSFYVGIDTLWMLPQDVNGDTANDWNLQVCIEFVCMNGLKEGVHGANSPYPFGVAPDTGFTGEHHFQFIGAQRVVDAGTPAARAYNTAPEGSIFGGLMFLRSRSSGRADTVFGFGAWRMGWDSAYLPPIRPVNGYVPKRADFKIVNGKVRYQP